MVKRKRENPPPSSDIWKISRDEYIMSKFPGATWDDIFGKFYDQQKAYRAEWDREVKLALTYGLLDEEKAKALKFNGFYGDAPVRPLPPTLYHVTSAKDAVVRDGLRTREQLGHGLGRGLGGGTPDTVSLTTSMEIATSIFTGLIEGNLVASGRLTIPMMIEMAREGAGASRPWLKEWFGYNGRQQNEYRYPDVPEKLQMVMDGFEYSGGWPQTVEKQNAEYRAATPWVGVEKWPHGEGLYRAFRRKLTEEELIDRWFDVYKSWISYRDSAGGIVNPVFFSSDAVYLSKIKPSQIAILQFRPRENAHGYFVKGEAEYRIWDGEAVEFVGVIQEG